MPNEQFMLKSTTLDKEDAIDACIKVLRDISMFFGLPVGLRDDAVHAIARLDAANASYTERLLRGRATGVVETADGKIWRYEIGDFVPAKGGTTT